MDFERKPEFDRPPEITDDRHWAWILLVVAGTNASAAAREVGYTEKYSKNQGHRLRRRYKEVLEKLIKEDLDYLESNAHRILAATAALAYSNMDNYLVEVLIPEEVDEDGVVIESARREFRFKPWDEIDIADKAAIRRIETKPDGTINIWLHGKERPLELLGQHESLWGKEIGERTVVHLNNHYGPDAPTFPENVG